MADTNEKEIEIEEDIADVAEAAPEEEKTDKKSVVKKKDKKISKEQEEINKLKDEITQKADQYLRLRAEYDNFRKRTQSEKDAIYNNAVSDTINSILPCLDNIDRALAQENASVEDLKKGIEMVANQFKSTFAELGVTEVGTVGDTFNPNIHNAVSHIEDDSLPENTISAVLQKGYMIGDRVVRHAMVQVSN